MYSAGRTDRSAPGCAEPPEGRAALPKQRFMAGLKSVVASHYPIKCGCEHRQLLPVSASNINGKSR